MSDVTGLQKVSKGIYTYTRFGIMYDITQINSHKWVVSLGTDEIGIARTLTNAQALIDENTTPEIDETKTPEESNETTGNDETAKGGDHSPEQIKAMIPYFFGYSGTETEIATDGYTHPMGVVLFVTSDAEWDDTALQFETPRYTLRAIVENEGGYQVENLSPYQHYATLANAQNALQFALSVDVDSIKIMGIDKLGTIPTRQRFNRYTVTIRFDRSIFTIPLYSSHEELSPVELVPLLDMIAKNYFDKSNYNRLTYPDQFQALPGYFVDFDALFALWCEVTLPNVQHNMIPIALLYIQSTYLGNVPSIYGE